MQSSNQEHVYVAYLASTVRLHAKKRLPPIKLGNVD